MPRILGNKIIILFIIIIQISNICWATNILINTTKSDDNILLSDTNSALVVGSSGLLNYSGSNVIHVYTHRAGVVGLTNNNGTVGENSLIPPIIPGSIGMAIVIKSGGQVVATGSNVPINLAYHPDDPVDNPSNLFINNAGTMSVADSNNAIQMRTAISPGALCETKISLINSGTITGNIDWVQGVKNDIITNTGTINGSILGGAGNNTLNNSATITGGVNLLTGNNTINLLSSPSITGAITADSNTENTLNIGNIVDGASYTTEDSISNMQTINTINTIAPNYFTINHAVDNIATLFDNKYGAKTILATNGDLSGGGSITNAGTIELTGGSIGKTVAMGDLTNSGTITSDSTELIQVANITNNVSATIDLKNTVNASGIITNNGYFNVKSGGVINGVINNTGTFRTAGIINNNIEFTAANASLELLGNSTFNQFYYPIVGIDGQDGYLTITATDDFTLHNTITNLNNIKITTSAGKVVTIKDYISGENISFSLEDANTTVNIVSGGIVSDTATINNLGSIMINGGNLGNSATSMAPIVNKGTVTLNSGIINTQGFTNNLSSKLEISGGTATVAALNNTLGTIEISGGDLSGSNTESTLNNATNQTITVAQNGNLGSNTPFSTINNNGIINVDGVATVTCDNFTNNISQNNQGDTAHLNITGGKVLANKIENTFGYILIDGNTGYSGDLSSYNSENLCTLINNSQQTIEVLNTGTIGNNLKLGAVTNYGTFNASGGNVVLGDLTNGNVSSNYIATFKINRGIVKTGNIANNLGTIEIFNMVDSLGNIYSGDLSSADYLNPSTLTNEVNQTITVASGTVGANNQLGAVTNYGTINVDNNFNVGAINNDSSGILNFTGGDAKVGNIFNTSGTITIGNNGGNPVDVSSIDPLNPSYITNLENQTITVSGSGTLGKKGAMGVVSNRSIFNATGGDIVVGIFSNANENATLNISSGNVKTGNVFNSGTINISGGDLSSADPTNLTSLDNQAGRVLTVSNLGTIGNAVDSRIGLFTNKGTFEANGGNIIIDQFLNEQDGINTGTLNISKGVFKIGSLQNNFGNITISSSGNLSGIASHINNISNGAGQTITVSGNGSIGQQNYEIGNFTNNGTINAQGGDFKIGEFTNNNINASLNITKGNIQTKTINNTLGSITIGSNNSYGDLSSITVNLSTLNNAANQNIAVSGFATIGNNTNKLGVINNYGNISAVTNVFKVTDINNYATGAISITNNNHNNTANGISIQNINNYGTLSIYNPSSGANSMENISINKFNNFSGATFNIYGPFQAQQNCVNNSGGVVNISSNLELVGNQKFINNGTANILAPVTLTGDYILGTTGTHIVNIDNGVVNTLTLTNDLRVSGGSTIKVNNTGNAILYDKQQFNITTGAGSSTLPTDLSTINIEGASNLVKYSLVKSDHDILLQINRTPISSVVSGDNNIPGSYAKVLDELVQSQVTDPTLKRAISELDALSNQQIKDAVTQLIPDPEISEITLATNGTVVPEVIAQRVEILARTNIDQLSTGYAAGGMQINKGLWIKGLGGAIKQDSRKGFSGYNANTVGVAFGADSEILNDFWFGLGLSSTGTEVRSKDQTSKKTRINSYQAIAYGSLSPGDYYIDLWGAMALNNYKTTRNIKYINEVATAKFRGVQPSAKISTGYIHATGYFNIIPNVSLHYSELYLDSYGETGAKGVALQKVSSNNLSQLEAGIGLKIASFDIDDIDQAFMPNIHFMVLYDFKASAQETTAQFIGGGGSFKVQSASPDKTTYNIGAGLIFKQGDSMQLTANYELRKKSKFIGHSGSLAVKYAI